MSLGSPVPWQWVFLNAPVEAADIWEMPLVIQVTAVIAITIFFLYDYINGSLIPTVALIESPELKDSELDAGEGTTTPTTPGRGPKDLEKGSGTEPTSPQRQDRPAGIGKFLHQVKTVVQNNAIAFAACYCLSYTDFVGDNFMGSMTSYTQLSIVTSIILTLSQDGTLLQSHPRAITTNRRPTRQYLQTQRGKWGVFHGLEIFLAHSLLSILIIALANPLIAWGNESFSNSLLTKLVLGLPLTTLHMGWIHTVISKPSTKPFPQRLRLFPSLPDILRIIPVASIDIILPPATYHFTRSILALAHAALLCEEDSDVKVSLFTIPLGASLLVSTITRAVYVRVAASMLPTDDEPIVPFDRTFGGVVGKRNPLSLVVGSCKTITGDQCYRYLKPLVDVVLWEMIGLFLLFVGFMVEGYFWAPPCWMLSFLARVVPGGAGGE